MPSVACAMVIGLLCVTAQDGHFRKTAPSFFEVDTFVTRDYQIDYTISDAFSAYDVKNYTRLCPGKGCGLFKATVAGCGVGLTFFGPADPPSGMNNKGYAVSSKSVAGLKRALAETYVQQRAGDERSYVALADLPGLDTGATQCPP